MCIQALQQLSVPMTKKQLHAILGAARYCQQWISSFGEITKPWVSLTKDQIPEFLHTEPQYLTALLYSSAGTSRLQSFSLFVQEHKGGYFWCPTSNAWTSPHPVAYYCAQPDSAATGAQLCLQAVAAIALVFGAPLVVQCPHQVKALVRFFWPKIHQIWAHFVRKESCFCSP